MAQVTMLDGAKTEGGTKILFEDVEADVRLILDFGINFDTVHKFFGNNFMDEVSNKTFEDKFKLYRSVGILPEVKFENFYYPHIVQSEEEFNAIPDPPVNGIILSHAHYDHQGHIKYINPKIPLYASPETIAFYKQMQIREWKASCGEPKFYAGNNEKYRKMIPTYHKKEIIFGNSERRLKIIPHYVDHSITGSMGFLLITSDDKHIVYTGDFGAPPDGAQKGWTADFIQFLVKNKPIYAMITDGTNIDKVDEEPAHIKQFFTLKRKIEIEIKASFDNGVMPSVCASGNNLPVIERVYQIALEMDKKLCVPVYVANLLVRLKESRVYDLPGYGYARAGDVVHHLEDLIIYQRWTFEFEDRFLGGNTLTGVTPERNDMREHVNKYSASTLQVVEHNFFRENEGKNQGNCILLLWEGDIRELDSMGIKEGSYFIHCYWEPFCEEFYLPRDKLDNWMKALKLHYISIPITGHMYREMGK